MSISIATHGRLCPVGGGRNVIVREHYTDINTNVVNPVNIVMEMYYEENIVVNIEEDEISSTIELVDTVNNKIIVSSISGNVEGCF